MLLAKRAGLFPRAKSQVHNSPTSLLLWYALKRHFPAAESGGGGGVEGCTGKWLWVSLLSKPGQHLTTLTPSPFACRPAKQGYGLDGSLPRSTPQAHDWLGVEVYATTI